MKIVAKALEAPIKQIAANAGLDGSVILKTLSRMSKNRAPTALTLTKKCIAT